MKSVDRSLLEWESRAQEVAGWAAALEQVTELNAPKAVCELLNEKLEEAKAALAAVNVSERFGPREQVLDLLADLTDRAHPRPPR